MRKHALHAWARFAAMHVYLFRGSACVDGAVNAYLNSGVLPAHDTSCTS